jgi:single-stranded-DNA-specific exonuclease
MSATTLPLTQWRTALPSQAVQDNLIKELGIHPIISRILAGRDILDPGEARRYLAPSLQDLHNPFLLKDMHKAAERVIKAIHNREKITVYGDYDADGITSVAVLTKFIQQVHPLVDYYIPDRILEGYGLNKNAVDKIKKGGSSLIITIDCGISDYEAVSYARSIGLDTVILDHHEVPGTIPDAVAVVNPNQSDCFFPFKYLAAVGIAFNFLIALRGLLRKEGFWTQRGYPNLREYLDLVAIGTIGDISPMLDENRIFTKIGLELITENRRTGLAALKEVSGIENQVIDSGKASFCLVPRINAAGRIGSPLDAVRLLLTDNIEEARDLARKLDLCNRKRQAMEKVIFSEIIDSIEEKSDLARKSVLVFASPKWHPGVIGIVASRLVDRYCRPAILISLKDGIGKGSGRSVSAFNIYEGLKKCDSRLLTYGGHRFAAGISIKEEEIQAFTDQLDAVIKEEATLVDFVSHTTIDAYCQLSDVNHALLLELDMLAPFGSQNPEPVLCARNVNVSASSIVGNNHLRMRVNGDGVSCNSIWFSKGHFLNTLSGPHLDIAFTPQINSYSGSSDIQLKMKDVTVQKLMTTSDL